MKRVIDRRSFLATAAAWPVVTAARPVRAAGVSPDPGPSLGPNIRLSCNFYTFNEPLQAGTMTLEEAIDFCAELRFDAVDLTGYYFPGYPQAPPETYVYETKRRASCLGLDVSGTGVRNDFTVADPAKRASDLALVKRWVGVAAWLDAPMLRVFAGHGEPEGRTREEIEDQVVECLEECAAYGERHGVMIALQNHNDAFKTAAEVLAIRERVPSKWFGLNVDIGSVRTADPYEEIARLAPFAFTWQIKENVYRRGVEEKVDLRRVFGILRDAGYRGYAPLEILGSGDPRPRIRRFLDEAREALA
jgi:sugar phosphate isomerase/epimerase